MKKIITIIALCAVSMIANAQNLVVDEIIDEAAKEAYNRQQRCLELYKKQMAEILAHKEIKVYLDPNNSIRDNYKKIDSISSLYKNQKYKIIVYGHYTSSDGDFYDYELGDIYLDYKKYEKVELERTSKLGDIYLDYKKYERSYDEYVSDNIFHVLHELYIRSLEKEFIGVPSLTLKEYYMDRYKYNNDGCAIYDVVLTGNKDYKLFYTLSGTLNHTTLRSKIYSKVLKETEDFFPKSKSNKKKKQVVSNRFGDDMYI